MIQSGEVGDREVRQMIDSIRGPIEGKDIEKVAEGITEKHELRILGAMVRGNEGFQNYTQMGANELREFLERYPLPMDFEEVGERYVKSIEQLNGERKGTEYGEALSSLMYKVYGKQYEYWQQYKAIKEEAEKEQQANRRTRDIGRAGLAGVHRERERSSEWAPGVVGFRIASEAQVVRGDVNRESVSEKLPMDEACQDSVLIDDEAKVYGVYDGAGGIAGGREASQLAVAKTKEFISSTGMQNGRDLASVLNRVDKIITEDPDAGMTTAVLAKLVDDGKGKRLAWASIGDSRIYIVRNERAYQITRDEGHGNTVTNSLGFKLPDGQIRGVQQFGDVNLRAGDKVMLCSDGITGDRGTDLMGNEEIASLIGRSHSAEEAATNLVVGARKRDDRSAIVFEV